MQNTTIRNAETSDYAKICSLNLADEQYTSPMDEVRLSRLSKLSCYFKIVDVSGDLSAFLLAMGSGAAYENDNFSWFARRYRRFIYVDRVVVSSAVRGLRLGSVLYEDLFRYARDNALEWVTCEYNIDPPNQASRLFHDKFGFKEVGTQWLSNGTKQVSLQVASTGITPASDQGI